VSVARRYAALLIAAVALCGGVRGAAAGMRIEREIPYAFTWQPSKPPIGAPGRRVCARAGHITAATGERHGGFALALEAYAPAIWRRFMFDQTASAKLIGVNPNPLDGPAAQALYDIVAAARKQNVGVTLR
jgi:hypothetical protein